MANIYKGTLGLVGNTPLVEVTNIEKDLNLNVDIFIAGVGTGGTVIGAGEYLKEQR